MNSFLRKDPTPLLPALLQRATKLGCWIEMEDGEEGGVEYTRHDVLGLRNEDNWYCTSLIFLPADGSVGIWTREMMAKEQTPLHAERNYIFDPASVEKWLDGWFENTVLEQLTKP